MGAILVPVGGGGLIAADRDRGEGAQARDPDRGGAGRGVAVACANRSASATRSTSTRPARRWPTASPAASATSPTSIASSSTTWSRSPKRRCKTAIVALVANDQVVAEASGAVGIAALRSGRLEGDRRPARGRGRHRRQHRRARPRPAALRAGVRAERPQDAWFVRAASGLLLAGGAGLGALLTACRARSWEAPQEPRSPPRSRVAWAAGRGSGAAFSPQRFPRSVRDFLLERYDHYERLPAPLRTRFEDDLRLFLGEKRITGVGVDVSDELRLLVAASAVTLSLGWPEAEWDAAHRGAALPRRLRSRLRARRTGAGRRGARLGHGDPLGSDAPRELRVRPRRLPRRASTSSPTCSTWSRPSSTACPADFEAASARAWAELVPREMERIRDGRSVLDEYGGADPVEFFPVAVEAFFERPRALRRRHHGALRDPRPLLRPGSGRLGRRARPFGVGSASVRLDVALIALHPELSRRKAREVIEKGQVSVDGRLGARSRRARDGRARDRLGPAQEGAAARPALPAAALPGRRAADRRQARRPALRRRRRPTRTTRTP